jgi:group I intron endonuclease
LIIDPVIYCITNIVNDKQYVGQAVIKAKRWKDHKSALSVGKHNNRYLQAAYNKYGKESFVYTVLEILPTLLNLDDREQHWINKLNTVAPNGYNLNPTAGSARGFKHSIETKMKWSEQRKGKKRSAEFALSVSIQMKGKIVSDETKQKQSLAQTGSTKSDETKAKHAARMKGNSHNKGKKRKAPMSDETRLRISEAKKAGYARRKALDNP